MKKIIASLLLSIFCISATSQSLDWEAVAGGQLSVMLSPNAPFPHPNRLDGHVYGDSLYSFEEHYNDPSVAIFLPANFQAGRKVDLVFYFHGWNNNIQKSIQEFRLLEQFTASNKNAIFVFAEGPKNAPDSFAGRMEEADVFKGLVKDVLTYLQQQGKIKSGKPGKIILAGHSGAYRGIAHILDKGGLTKQISEVYLFDALYAEEEKYLDWLENQQGRMINIITSNGGTLDNSLAFLDELKQRNMAFSRFEKNEFNLQELNREKITFVFTNLGHSEVIDPYFELLLKSSQLRDLK